MKVNMHPCSSIKTWHLGFSKSRKLVNFTLAKPENNAYYLNTKTQDMCPNSSTFGVGPVTQQKQN